eukprot:gnl/TRDRNA2_/TRDRNA2_134090_c0_seq1.p1 gnl/TRDRNA2_/TRDRNA2_134090_c0~~gnl/TRDRNA2_/TRDRNA2_134090_c0_seq1.p1  ORF type:complete len:357 (-),score=64.28 gnl/TRDRNA2_/TRDRNA2_134090_c0_seq1:168-1238(-)
MAVPAAVGDRDERTARFLLEASHMYALLAPAASRSMLARMRAVAAAGSLDIHSSVSQRYCARCSQVCVPGSTGRVSVELGKRPWRRLRHRQRRAKDVPSKNRRRLPGAQGAANIRADGIGTVASGKRLYTPQPAARCVCYTCGVCGHSQRQTIPKRPLPPATKAHDGRLARAEEAALAKKAVAAAKKAKRGEPKDSDVKGRDSQGGSDGNLPAVAGDHVVGATPAKAAAPTPAAHAAEAGPSESVASCSAKAAAAKEAKPESAATASAAAAAPCAARAPFADLRAVLAGTQSSTAGPTPPRISLRGLDATPAAAAASATSEGGSRKRRRGGDKMQRALESASGTANGGGGFFNVGL